MTQTSKFFGTETISVSTFCKAKRLYLFLLLVRSRLSLRTRYFIFTYCKVKIMISVTMSSYFNFTLLKLEFKNTLFYFRTAYFCETGIDLVDNSIFYVHISSCPSLLLPATLSQCPIQKFEPH